MTKVGITLESSGNRKQTTAKGIQFVSKWKIDLRWGVIRRHDLIMKARVGISDFISV